jgi:TRAP-type C4-dicarboxylate transport system substrate-binding protein
MVKKWLWKNTGIVGIAVILTLILSSGIAICAPKTITYRLATGAPDNSPTSEELKQWATDIKKATKGRLKIDIYFGAALGQSTDLFKSFT